MRPPSRFCLDFREASININDSARRRQGSCVSADLEGITTPLQPSTRTDSVVDHVASRLRGPRHDSGPEGRRREVAKTAKPRDVETIQTSGTSHSSSWEMHRKSDDQTFSSTGNRTSRALGEKWLVLGAPNTCIIRETAPLIDVTIGKVMPSYRTLAAPGHRQVKR